MSKNDNDDLAQMAKQMGVNLSFADNDDNEDKASKNDKQTDTKKETKSNQDTPSKSVDKKQNETKHSSTQATTENPNNIFKQLNQEETNETKESNIKLVIIDTNTSAKQIKNINGNIGKNANIKLQLNRWLQNNYELVDKDLKLDDIKFKKQSQSFTINLKHKTKSVTRHKTIKETIEYSSTDNLINQSPKTQILNISQNGKQDLVNNQLTWSSEPIVKEFKAVKSPAIKGYSPDSSQIDAVTITVTNDNWDTDLNIERIVNYTPDKRQIIIEYIDETAHANTKKILNGHTNEVAKYSTKPIIDAFLKQGGFKLVKDETQTNNLKFKADDKPSVYKVILKHKLQMLTADQPIAKNGENLSSKLTKTVTRTINIILLNRPDLKQKPIVQKAVFNRKGVYDFATKTISVSKWPDKEQTIPAIKAPAVPGYTVISDSLDAIQVNKDSNNVVEQFQYKPVKKSINLVFIDNSLHRQIYNKVFYGKANEKLKFNYKAYINALEKSGVKPTKESFAPALNAIFEPKDSGQTIKIFVDHDVRTVTPDSPINPKNGDDLSGMLTKTVKRTIEYKLPKTLTDFPDNTKFVQTAKFTRNAKVDMTNLNGKPTFTAWSENVVLPEIKVPQVDGFVPSVNKVPKRTVRATDNGSNVEVVYTPKIQTINLVVYDKTTKKTIGNKTMQGRTNTRIPLSNEKLEDMYTSHGYTIVDNQFAGKNIYSPHNGRLECKLIVEHGYKLLDVTDPINPMNNKDMTNVLETTKNFVIKYEFFDGKQAQPDNKQILKLTRTGRLDLTDGEIQYSDWSVENALNDVVSPHMDDYIPNKKMVTAPSLFKDSQSSFVTKVIYYIATQTINLRFVDKNKKLIKEYKVDIDYNSKQKIPIKDYFNKITKMGYGINVSKDYPEFLEYDTEKADEYSYTINVHETFNVNTDTKQIIRKITINMPNGTINYIPEIVKLKRKITISNVTGKEKQSPWTTGFWSQIDIPQVEGYEPNINLVPPQDITPDSHNVSVNIKYIKKAPAKPKLETSSSPTQPQYTEPVEKPKKVGFWHRFFGFGRHKKTYKALPAPKH